MSKSPITSYQPPNPKIAIVAEFLTTMGGAENVVLALHEMFPEAPIYTALYNPEKVPAFAGADVRSSSLQKLPRFLRQNHRYFPTLSARAFRSFDLSEYDIIITSAYLNANQVRKTRSDQILISYCHTPARYYWSHYDLYRNEPGFGPLNPLIRLLMSLLVPGERQRDYQAVQNVDVFIANSSESQARIKKYYGKTASIVHPPVETKRFQPARDRANYYVALGRQLPNKRFDLAVDACTKLGVPLKVFGNGPMHDDLVKRAGPTVSFYTDRFGDASDETVTHALNHAKGFVFPSDEDFGIVTVEALAAGTPVIGYAKAGTLDIVTDGETGVLFKNQTVDDVMQAIQRAESIRFFPSKLNRHAKRFDKSLFITKIRKIVQDNRKESR